MYILNFLIPRPANIVVVVIVVHILGHLTLIVMKVKYFEILTVESPR